MYYVGSAVCLLIKDTIEERPTSSSHMSGSFRSGPDGEGRAGPGKGIPLPSQGERLSLITIRTKLTYRIFLLLLTYLYIVYMQRV